MTPELISQQQLLPQVLLKYTKLGVGAPDASDSKGLDAACRAVGRFVCEGLQRTGQVVDVPQHDGVDVEDDDAVGICH